MYVEAKRNQRNKRYCFWLKKKHLPGFNQNVFGKEKI